MRIAVLCSSESWYLRDLQRAAGDRHELVQVRYSQLTAEICDDTFRVSCDGVVLNDFDAVLVRTMPPGSLEQVVFRMDALAHLEAAGTLVLNPPKAIEAAVDKYLALARLQAIGVPTPRTIVCQTADEAIIAFESLGECAVVKPLFGGEGRGIARLDDEAMAQRAFKMLEQLGRSDLSARVHRAPRLRHTCAADWRRSIRHAAQFTQRLADQHQSWRARAVRRTRRVND